MPPARGPLSSPWGGSRARSLERGQGQGAGPPRRRRGPQQQIRVVTRRSYGFRTYKAMKTALFHTLGQLPGHHLPTDSAEEAKILTCFLWHLRTADETKFGAASEGPGLAAPSTTHDRVSEPQPTACLLQPVCINGTVNPPAGTTFSIGLWPTWPVRGLAQPTWLPLRTPPGPSSRNGTSRPGTAVRCTFTDEHTVGEQVRHGGKPAADSEWPV